MAQIGRGKTKISSKTNFQVDISEILTAVDKMDKISTYVLQEISQEITALGRDLLGNLFEQAMDRQDYDAFPEAFRDHIRTIVGESYFHQQVTSTSLDVSYDFNQLGDKEDLKKAFHQGARTADGEVIDGPYENEELANPTRDRHLYWEAMVKGEKSGPNPANPEKKMRIKEGAWEETQQKYIEIWGDKAPQWLYLQFGQNRWDPKLKPSSIIEDFTEIFQRRAKIIYEDRLTFELEEAQHTASTPFGRRLVAPTEELGPSGKPRQPGQFYPKIRR